MLEAKYKKEPTGNAQITLGYCLPSKYVLHTVGPIYDGVSPVSEGSFMYRQLASSYESCLNQCCVDTNEATGQPLNTPIHHDDKKSSSSSSDGINLHVDVPSSLTRTSTPTIDTSAAAADEDDRNPSNTSSSSSITSIAFCCISTGVFGYPNEAAAHTAVNTVRSWLLAHGGEHKMKRVVFNVFTDVDESLYHSLLSTQ
jgi:O-acetyl-ADP-ribose deacetylase (regulator of RNase III)